MRIRSNVAVNAYTSIMWPSDVIAIIFFSICLSWVLPVCLSGTPAPPNFFDHQLVDHLSEAPDPFYRQEWSQRYYIWDKEFLGPGHPIFLILGGEGAIEPEAGLHYPFITHHLAKDFGAYVLEPEHRFYGQSQPLSSRQKVSRLDSDPRQALLTSEQALYDAVRLLQHVQKQLGCSLDHFSPNYCPVIAVGGSYPGFLSAMARVRFPHVIDISYAASAPVKFYAQQVDSGAYYEHISKVAEASLPGCSKGVRSTLDAVSATIAQSVHTHADLIRAASELGVCTGTLPAYFSSRNFQDEMFMVVGYTFANANMANYPPDNRTSLYKSCQAFLSPTLEPMQRVKKFFIDRLSSDGNCFNLTKQLPTGPNATLSGGGTGRDGEIWDFQTCTLLVEAIGFSNRSMFPPRTWTMDWLNQHCRSRFQVKPDPYRLVRAWRFDDLLDGANASRIIFTNGLNDGWSVSGILSDLSDSLIALNFENGAHHSDLSGRGPSDDDTDDIRKGFQTIRVILSSWLGEIRALQVGQMA